MKRKITLFLGCAGLLGLCWHQVLAPADRIPEPTAAPPTLATEAEDSSQSKVDDRDPAVQTPAVSTVIQPETSGPLPPPQARSMDEYEILLQNLSPRLADDPHMEDMLRDRLWLALDQLNCPLLGSLGFTPVEIEKFKALVADNLIAAAGRTTPDSPFAVEVQLDAALAMQRAEFDAQLRQLLGDARFAAYAAARQDLARFNRLKFLNPQEPLTDGQTGDVLAAIATEKQTVNAAAARLWAEEGVDPESASVEQQADWAAQIQELTDQRIYVRLRSLLSPDRLAAFAEYQAAASR